MRIEEIFRFTNNPVSNLPDTSRTSFNNGKLFESRIVSSNEEGGCCGAIFGKCFSVCKCVTSLIATIIKTIFCCCCDLEKLGGKSSIGVLEETKSEFQNLCSFFYEQLANDTSDDNVDFKAIWKSKFDELDDKIKERLIKADIKLRYKSVCSDESALEDLVNQKYMSPGEIETTLEFIRDLQCVSSPDKARTWDPLKEVPALLQSIVDQINELIEKEKKKS